MPTKKETTLRLNMPQWQGGNRHDYYFGSQLLAWLAPPANGPVETVPVSAPKPVETLEVENSILGRKALLRQARAARKAIEKHCPDRIVTLGGDCLIDLAPMAYLNTRYGAQPVAEVAAPCRRVSPRPEINCVLPLPAGRFSNAGIDWPFDASIIVEISALNNLETHTRKQN